MGIAILKPFLGQFVQMKNRLERRIVRAIKLQFNQAKFSRKTCVYCISPPLGDSVEVTSPKPFATRVIRGLYGISD